MKEENSDSQVDSVNREDHKQTDQRQTTSDLRSLKKNLRTQEVASDHALELVDRYWKRSLVVILLCAFFGFLIYWFKSISVIENKKASLDFEKIQKNFSEVKFFEDKKNKDKTKSNILSLQDLEAKLADFSKIHSSSTYVKLSNILRANLLLNLTAKNQTTEQKEFEQIISNFDISRFKAVSAASLPSERITANSLFSELATIIQARKYFLNKEEDKGRELLKGVVLNGDYLNLNALFYLKLYSNKTELKKTAKLLSDARAGLKQNIESILGESL